jgi:hypothetical protein
MSRDAVDVVAILGSIALIVCAIIFFLSPSPMQICIKAGYEWRGGDCVMGVDHD